MTGHGPIVITCEHVHVAYGIQEVLHDVCLEIPQGVLLPFVGPNGAGKTTLLRAILGLVPVRAGVIRAPFSVKTAGYVPQEKVIDPLYPVTTRQIVEMGLYPELGWWRRPQPEHKKRVRSVMEGLGLSAHHFKTFGELSGGMKQKALLARALVSEADVFVLDEPTSELDEQTEREVLAYLLDLVRRKGKTVLMAHHGLEQATMLSSTVCVVNRGRAILVSVEEARGLLSGASSLGRSIHV